MCLHLPRVSVMSELLSLSSYCFVILRVAFLRLPSNVMATAMFDRKERPARRGGKSEARVKEKEMGRRRKLLGSWEQELKFTAVYYLLEVITSIMKVRGREEMEK